MCLQQDYPILFYYYYFPCSFNIPYLKKCMTLLIFSMTLQAWKLVCLNSMTFQDQWSPCFHSKVQDTNIIKGDQAFPVADSKLSVPRTHHSRSVCKVTIAIKLYSTFFTYYLRQTALARQLHDKSTVLIPFLQEKHYCVRWKNVMSGSTTYHH